MKKNNNNIKKGFTLVELLVVIAILAILAVVSVVGYTSFTKKAKIADDISLTTQLNTILQANETTDGANKYPHEAALELVDGGFDVTKFTPTTEKYHYVYDLSQNRVFLLDESYTVVAPSDLTLSANKETVFGFAGTQEEVTKFNSNGYSVYLKNTYNSDTVNTSKGVDVGENRLSYINYANSTSLSGEVVLRTNSAYTTLTISDSTSTKINHYGKLGKLVVEACGYECYYESGTTAYAKVTKGMIVAKESGVISVLYATSPVVAAKTDGGDIKAAYCVSTQETESGNSGYTSFSTAKGGNITFEYSSTLDEKTIESKGGSSIVEISSTEGSITPENKENGVVLNYTTGMYYSKAQGTDTDTVIYCGSAEAALRSAVDNAKDGDMLYLFEDVTFTDLHNSEISEKASLNIVKSVMLDGQEHTIKYNNPTENFGTGNIINVINIDNGTVSIKNITLKSEMKQYTGIYVGDLNNNKYNFSLNLENVTIDTRDIKTNACHGYPIKIDSDAQYINVNLNGVTTYGYGGIQSTSNGVKLVANNCTFNTANIVNSDGESNCYSAVIVSDYYNNSGAKNSEGNDFTFNKCSFVATHVVNSQKVLDIRSPFNNIARLNDCTFECDNDYVFGVCFASQYSNDESRSDASYDGTSRIYIDNKDVTYTDDRIFNYLDAPEQYKETYTITFKVNPFEILGDYLADKYDYVEGKAVATNDNGNVTTTWEYEDYVEEENEKKVKNKYKFEAKVVEDKSAKTWTLTITKGSKVTESNDTVETANTSTSQN